MEHIHLGAIDYTILLIYFGFVLGIGWVLRRWVKSGEDFFLSGRSIPAWVAGLAFISANLGAQEVIGMGASGAKYGMMTSHFYWLAGALGAGVPEAPVRREDPRLQRDHLRGDDGLLLRHLDVRAGQAAGADPRLELQRQRHRVGPDCAGLHLPGRAHLGDLQRGAAVLPDRAGVPAAGAARPQGRGRVVGADGQAPYRGHPGRLRPGLVVGLVGPRGERARQPDGCRVVRPGHGAGVRAVVRLLVHGLPGDPAGDGGGLDDVGPPHPAARGCR